MTSTWTAADIANLTELRIQGKSFTQIAKVLHRTRNACIGWAQRHLADVPSDRQIRAAELNRRREIAAKAVATKQAKAATQAAAMETAEPVSEKGDWRDWEEAEAKQVRHRLFGNLPLLPLLELKPHQCRWPVENDPKVTGGYLFCARATDEGSSYCAHHRKLAVPAGGRSTLMGGTT